MKTRNLFFALVAATMMFANCGKSNDNGDNNGNDNPQDTIPALTSFIVYDDLTYPMYNLDETHVGSSCSIGTSVEICFWAHNTFPRNKEIDLAHPTAGNLYWFSLDKNGATIIQAFGQGKEDGTFDGFGEIDGETINGEAAFSSGTYCVSTADPNGEGNPNKIELDGVLRNGKRLQVKLYTNDNQ